MQHAKPLMENGRIVLSNDRFKTGDIAVKQADEYFKILGRESVDIIKTGGFKVSALEIEKEILEHSNIRDIAIVGIPSDEWGQIIGAMITLKQGTMSLQDLQDYLKPKLASYKIPKKLKILNDMPRNALGKVNKKEIVTLFA